MNIKLEVGKTYTMRNGIRVKITGIDTRYYVPFVGEYEYGQSWWYENGSYKKTQISSMDIVSEYTEPEPPK